MKAEAVELNEDLLATKKEEVVVSYGTGATATAAASSAGSRQSTRGSEGGGGAAGAGGGGGRTSDKDKVIVRVAMEGQKLQPFKVLKSDALAKVFEAYAKAKKLQREDLVFRYNGDVLDDVDQPRYLQGMILLLDEDKYAEEDVNVIEVMDKAALARAKEEAAAAAAAAAQTIQFVLKWPGGEQKVKMGMQDTFAATMQAFARAHGMDAARLKFKDCEGNFWTPGATPKGLGMEDEDAVDVYGMD